MGQRPIPGLLLVGVVLFLPHETAADERTAGLAVNNGWYVHNEKAVWGLAQHNGWWRAGQRPNLARNAVGQIGPNRTENFDKLTNAMLRFGYPGFEHNFGLWYDRRRDAHDEGREGRDPVRRAASEKDIDDRFAVLVIQAGRKFEGTSRWPAGRRPLCE
jgi:hypothetical protein